MDDQIRINTHPAPVPANDGYKRPSSGGHKDLISTIAIIILAPLIALFLTAFVFQSYEVDGPSMEPTLHDNDRLIVNKTGRTWAKIFSSDYNPQRYDIVVFNQNSSGPDGSEHKQLIKRVIGVPGDRVVIKDGKVTVYNQQNPDGFAVDEQGPHANIVEYTDGHIEQNVEDGEIFVMGDNRKNSLDSRAFGAIDSEEVVGTLSVRIYPFGSMEKF